MDDDLIAVGHFFNSREAYLARNRLVADGIDAEVADDMTADMNWGLTNAIRGVKVLVRKSDHEKATAILADPVSGEEVERAFRESEDSVDEPDDDIEPLNAREQLADRTFRTAVLAVVFLPFQFYVFWLLIRVFISDEPLRPEHRRRAWIAAAINLPFVALFCFILRWMIQR